MRDKWNKNIVLFLASQTISLFGTSLVQYAITWYITLKTQSGVMMTISIICGFLPTFFLSPFGGVWADRYNRKILIILSDSLIAISTLVLALLFFMGYDSLGLLFVMSAIRAFGSGIQTPAINAFIPQLVSKDNLTSINATNSSIQSLVMLISPMISAAIMSYAPIETIFLIDVFTAAIAVIILMLFLHVPVHAKALSKQEASYWSDMKKGLSYIKNHSFLKTFFLYSTSFFLLISPAAFLTPLQVARSFSDDVLHLAAVEITFSVGMMLGGITIASWGGFKNKLFTMALANLVIGCCTFALGIVPIMWIYLFFMLLTGVSVPFFNTTSTVLLQEKVEEDYLGRVFGVLSMISSIMMPMAMLVFGPLSDRIKIEFLLIATGALMALQSILMYRNKTLIEATKPSSIAEQSP
ncbi:MFS transporter [Acetivibrio mesophilus]|uniref:MFS transporter n=1 Tax=Acetivibrio mesophilus TaxID=2487273 RepID=A0A4Q0I7W6_9FIRM|nr:MFS transporter [Acetivibrio mesophilus]ODM25025.1 MFS transporter [Clostridium sp. Bc-iso-3]RXE59975.1 MFS transporter [Acetivibrio mesophilus]HHV29438.1 MFS transporter [Clostridium sp.]